MKLQNQLNQIIVKKLSEQNSDVDEELIAIMADELVNEMMCTIYVMTDNLICGRINNEMGNDIMKREERETKGVWLYVESSVNDWEMIKVPTIEEAVMNAMNRIENTKIIVNGNIIDWDVIDNNNAYYMDNGRMIVFRCEERIPVRIVSAAEEAKVSVCMG